MVDIYDDLLMDMTSVEDLTVNPKIRDVVTSKLFNTEECNHSETIIVNGTEVCSDCNQVIQENPVVSTDARYYGSNEQKFSKDPTRTHKRKTEQRSIIKDVEGMDFPESIVSKANLAYQQVIGTNIYRGAKRKAIIVACLYHAYMDQEEFQPVEKISAKFNIKKKSVKEGFEKYAEKFPQSTTKYIRPRDLVRKVVIDTGINFRHLRHIKILCDFLENKSELLNRSSPQSVAAAIVYVYLCLEPEYKEELGITKNNFAKINDLSDITILKLGKEITSILDNDNLKI